MQQSIIRAALSAIMQEAEATTRAGGAAASKPKFCDKSWDERGVCYFKFGNGTQLELDTNSCNAETQLNLRCHGANQKVGDSFAGVKGNYNEGIAKAQAVIDQLYAGAWNADREGGPRLADLAEAIARIKSKPLEVARAAVEKATDEQRRAWRSAPGVKAMMAKIASEKAEAQLAAAGDQAEIEIDFGS